MKRTPSVVGPLAPANLLRTMQQGHVALERSLKDLTERSYEGEPAAIRAAFEAIERELRAHLEAEEQDLLPVFEGDHPAEADRVREEHAVIRRRLDDLGLALELHVLRAGMIEDFLDLLSRHATYEELALYRWADTSLPAPERRALLDRMLSRLDERGAARRA